MTIQTAFNTLNSVKDDSLYFMRVNKIEKKNAKK